MHGLGYLPPPASVPTTSTQYAWGAYTTHGYSHRARQNSNVCNMHGLGCYSHQPELLTILNHNLFLQDPAHYEHRLRPAVPRPVARPRGPCDP